MGGLALSFGQWAFPVPPVVGMGLVFLEQSPDPGDPLDDLGMSPKQCLKPQARTEGTLGWWLHPQKLLTMMPTEEERQKIEEAQQANPDVPLGPAENFLMTLASIGGLAARLQLWAFKLDYDSMERVLGIWGGAEGGPGEHEDQVI